MTDAQVNSKETLGRLLGIPADTESRVAVLHATTELFTTAEKAGSIEVAEGLEIVRGLPGLSARPGDELIVARKTDTGAYTITRNTGAPEISMGSPNPREARSVSYELSADGDSLRAIGFNGIFGYAGSKRDKKASDGGMRTSFIGWSADNLLERYGMVAHLEEDTGPVIEIQDTEKAKQAAQRLAYVNRAVAQCLRLDVMFMNQPGETSRNWRTDYTSTESPPLPLAEIDLIGGQLVRHIPAAQAA